MSMLPQELQARTSRESADYSASQAAIQSRRGGSGVPAQSLAKPGQDRYHHTTNGKWQGAAVARNNVLYLVVGALAVAVAVLGYQLYQDRKKPEGVNINLGPGGISIEKK
jgi:hypothetical protein